MPYLEPTRTAQSSYLTGKIKQSLELQSVLDTAVAEVRTFLKSDRVKIYQFDSDGNGKVVAESINGDRFPSLKGLHFSVVSQKLR